MRLWKNWNPYTLLVGKQNGAITVEKFDSFPKVKHRITISPSNSTPRYIPQRTETRCSNKSWTQTLIAALLTWPKGRKPPNCPSADEWINQNVAYPLNGILFSHEKE